MVGRDPSMTESPFRDRREAGRRLGEALEWLRDERPVVLALPRGGVPVAAEVARHLGAPLDVIVVRKLGLPMQPELGFGAIGEGGVRLVDRDLIRRAGLAEGDLVRVEAHERQELARQVRLYRGDRPPIPVAGRTVVIIDDGLATGATARAAVEVVREQGARRIVVAVPVAPRETVRRLEAETDRVVSLVVPADFVAVGMWYRDFEQTSDEEVARLLRAGAEGADGAEDGGPEGADSGGGVASRQRVERDVVIPDGGVELEGRLVVPAAASGIVLFAHGSGSSRHSPRNVATAQALQAAGLGTLLFDLLTDRESADRRNVFDIELLGTRLLGASEWMTQQPDVSGLPYGYFGASTGGGAALWAAGAPGSRVSAVVSRGGRPDLAGSRLPDVQCPTLLVVGGADAEVLELNRWAASFLRCRHQVAVVPGATHLFEEEGALAAVARLAIGWFRQFL